MLSGPKSDALISNFAGQWLQLRNLKGIVPDSDTFPDFDDNLRQAFRREAELFFASIVREDRNVLDLMTADYTFVNERLAKHYRLPNVFGSDFRRVTLADETRRGLLGKGAVLLVTSHATTTSPVLRGKWVLENLLGSPPPPPPPDVPALREDEPGGPRRTMREQMEQHRNSPACASCHKAMDPFGFALENFDVVGAWRTANQTGAVIDAADVLPNGARVDGVAGLRKALLERPDVFVQTLTEKLFVYALGRGLTYQDMPAVRKIVRDARAQDYRFSASDFGYRWQRTVPDGGGFEAGRTNGACSSPGCICPGERFCAASARPSRCRCSTRWCRRPRRSRTRRPLRRGARASSTCRTARTCRPGRPPVRAAPSRSRRRSSRSRRSRIRWSLSAT